MCESCQKTKDIINYETAVKIAQIEANNINNAAVVYKYKEKYYGECRDCWRKAGSIGELIITVYPV